MQKCIIDGIQLQCRNNVFQLFHKSTYISSKWFSTVIPAVVSPVRNVPSQINKPYYAVASGNLYLKFLHYMKTPRSVKIKSSEQIERIRESCALARNIMDLTRSKVKPGVTTDFIDKTVHELCVRYQCYPSPLLYKGFPKSVCTSVNNVVCHGIPDDRPLEDGDIVSVDITVFYNGYHGDLCETWCVGNVDDEGRHLVGAAELCRDAAIAICKPGQPLNIIGATISDKARSLGVNVIPNFCGHGIGEIFHEPPDIIHIENNRRGTMEDGMVFTIEPVICEGHPDIEVLDDGWTACTVDQSRAAQFEHTILITKHGADILTK